MPLYHFMANCDELTYTQCIQVIHETYARRDAVSVKGELLSLVESLDLLRIKQAIEASLQGYLNFCKFCNTFTRESTHCGKPVVFAPCIPNCHTRARHTFGHDYSKDHRKLFEDAKEKFREGRFVMNDLVIEKGAMVLRVFESFLSKFPEETPYYERLLVISLLINLIYKNDVYYRNISSINEEDRRSTYEDIFEANENARKDYRKNKVDFEVTDELLSYWADRYKAPPEEPIDVEFNPRLYFTRYSHGTSNLDKAIAIAWLELNRDAHLDSVKTLVQPHVFMIKKKPNVEHIEFSNQRMIALYPTVTNMIISTMMKKRFDTTVTNYKIVRCGPENKYIKLDIKNAYDSIPHKYARAICRDFPFLERLITGPIERLNGQTVYIERTKGLLPGSALAVHIFEIIMQKVTADLDIDLRYVDDFRIYKNTSRKIDDLRTRLLQYGFSINMDKTEVIDVKHCYVDVYLKRPVIVLSETFANGDFIHFVKEILVSIRTIATLDKYAAAINKRIAQEDFSTRLFRDDEL
jgi:hypothetical protein